MAHPLGGWRTLNDILDWKSNLGGGWLTLSYVLDRKLQLDAALFGL